MKNEDIRSNLVLKDIARISGFSRSTVSRVLNDQPRVSDDTRQKILKIIEQYNFEPNPVARALVSQSSRVLSVLIPHVITDLFSDPFFALLLQSITSTANQLDYSVNLWLESSHGSVNEFYQRALRYRLADGWIIASARVDRPVMHKLVRQGKPFLLVGQSQFAAPNVHFVDAENRHGARLMVRHLIGRGYKRIGMICGRQDLFSSEARQQGYFDALREAGYPLDTTLITEPHDYTEAGGYAGMKRLLPCQVDAVFAANDVIAVGALRAIREAGLRVPQDIALSGFDDLPLARLTDPPLTTIRQPVQELGAAAVEGLIQVIEGYHTRAFQRVLPVELIIRGST
jgi:LacI family transcriptional regulator